MWCGDPLHSHGPFSIYIIFFSQTTVEEATQLEKEEEEESEESIREREKGTHMTIVNGLYCALSKLLPWEAYISLNMKSAQQIKHRFV